MQRTQLILLLQLLAKKVAERNENDEKPQKYLSVNLHSTKNFSREKFVKQEMPQVVTFQLQIMPILKWTASAMLRKNNMAGTMMIVRLAS